MKITAKNLIAFAILTGKDYDFFTAPETSTGPTTYIGINMSDGIWYWWTYRIRLDDQGLNNAPCTGDEEFSFKSRYSQLSGKTTKGFRTGWNVEDRIEAKLKKLNYFDLLHIL